MGKQIAFFRKNHADYEISTVSASASESSDQAHAVLDRSNFSSWMTTGSVDANGTFLEVNMGDVRTVSELLLLKHNFKNYHVQYWDDVALSYQEFSPAINPSANSAASNWHRFAAVQTSKIKITINGTQIANSEKYLYQFIATELIGQLDGWPVIKDPSISRGLKLNTMLSGRGYLLESLGQYTAKLTVENWKSDADLSIVEALFNSNEGFLFWPCGGDETQFSSRRIGYRMEDLFLMRCSNAYKPEFYKGIYVSGMKIEIDLVEVVT
jgi:hypothetical protein